MKKLLSTKYSAGAFNTAMLILRLGLGILMMLHGYQKLVHFGDLHNKFMNFLGIGSTLSLALVIFAEFFCSLFLILGLFSRLATIPLIITMCVVIFKVNNGHFVDEDLHAEPALYLIGYLTVLLVGPGKISIDNMTGK
ncbi:MAG: DoxX family protein [Bacteroidetes bacterium]|nr:DoxX family protein [Bacteroidota bacterium]